MLLGVLALALAAGLLSFGELKAPLAVPDGPMPPPPALPEPTGPEAVVGPLPTAEPLPRVAGQLEAAADLREASVEVRVEYDLGTLRRAAPFVEIAMACGDQQWPARTGDDGRATFTVRGGHGRTATLRCPLGAAAAVTLSAEQTTPVVLTIAARTLLRGTVSDTAGRPIADATIAWLPWASSDDATPAPVRIGRSRADGSYEVAVAVGGRLGAHHAVYGPSPMYLVQVAAAATVPPPVLTQNLVLAATPGQISGTVRDHLGQPVAGAELEFRSAAKAPRGAELAAVPMRSRTDARGGYLVARLLPGEIHHAVRASGHGPSRGTLRLRVGEARQLDLQLPPPLALTGTVRHTDGTPAAARVVLGEAEDFLRKVALTAADGSYRVDDLGAGEQTARAEALHGTAASRPAVETTRVLQPDVANVWDPILPTADAAPAPNLHGTLVDANGRPLGGWRLVARPAGGGQISHRSEADGTFAFRVPGDRLCDLRAYAPQQPMTGFASAVRRGIDPATSPVEFKVTTGQGGRLVGRSEAADGRPLPATITGWHFERAERVSFQASAQGVIDLADLPAGTLDLLFEHPGFASVPQRNLTVGPRQLLDLGTIKLSAGGTVHGTVRGPGGTAPDDCQLTMLSAKEAGPRYFPTYTAGSFTFPTMPPGDYHLVVQANGLAARTLPVAVVVDTSTPVDVDLDVGVARRVKVVLPPAAPGTFQLAFRPARPPLQWLTATSVPGDPALARSQDFTVCLPPGEYFAVAWAVGGPEVGRYEARETVQFRAGDESEVVLELQKQ